MLTSHLDCTPMPALMPHHSLCPSNQILVTAKLSDCKACIHSSASGPGSARKVDPNYSCIWWLPIGFIQGVINDPRDNIGTDKFTELKSCTSSSETPLWSWYWHTSCVLHVSSYLVYLYSYHLIFYFKSIFKNAKIEFNYQMVSGMSLKLGEL